jgi:hypothetical protein
MLGRKLRVAVGNYYSNPKKNQECRGTGRVLKRYPVFDHNGRYCQKGIKGTCTILGYAVDWVVATSSKAPIRAETRLNSLKFTGNRKINNFNNFFYRK